MDAVIEYIIVGLISLAFAFVTTPVLLEFYSQARNASAEQGGQTGAIVDIVLLLVLSMFYFFLVWMFYGAVKQKIDSM